MVEPTYQIAQHHTILTVPYKMVEPTYQTAQHHITLTGSHKMVEHTYQTTLHHTTLTGLLQPKLALQHHKYETSCQNSSAQKF
jgi:hypothetical protein